MADRILAATAVAAAVAGLVAEAAAAAKAVVDRILAAAAAAAAAGLVAEAAAAAKAVVDRSLAAAAVAMGSCPWSLFSSSAFQSSGAVTPLDGRTVHVARPSVHRPATVLLTVARHDVQSTPDQASSTAAEVPEEEG